jgi:hypothetical protein
VHEGLKGYAQKADWQAAAAATAAAYIYLF